jgi:protocatechuate 3,4-dioxygenase beta subunit
MRRHHHCTPTVRLALGLSLVATLGVAASFTLGGAAAAAGPGCPASNAPNTMTLVGGTPQTAKLHQPFQEMFQVALANTNGCPLTTNLAGVAVTFTAPSSGATGTFAASGSNVTTVGTGASGQASASGFTANGTTGSYTVTASSADGTVSFTLTNTASGIAATIAADAPTSQSATVGTGYPQPLQATVRDANGNPVEGAQVTFSLGAGSGAAGGGGSAQAGATFDGGESQATELTDASGAATSPHFTANGTAGAFTATAATAGVVEPAGFALDNLAGKPATITALAPTKQSATVGKRYSKPLEVKVLDGNGKPLQGATVTFSLGPSAAGGGSGGAAAAGATFVGGSAQATETTDASGIATSPRFSANTTAGRFTATATATGTNAAAGFSLDNLAAKPPTIVALGASKRSAPVGSRYTKPLKVKVHDGSGKPLQGATVTFTLGAGAAAQAGAGGSSSAGASFVGGSSQATETTNAAGIATSPRLSANTTAGSFTATATTDGTTNAVTFQLQNRPGKPTTLSAGVAATESTAVGTRFPVRLAVTVIDKNSNPVAGVTVTFSAPRGGPSGHFGSATRTTVKVKTDAKGIAVAPAFTANHTQGGYVVQAHAAGHAAAFALVNQPGA